MRFAHVLLDNISTIVAQSSGDSWRNVDVAHNMFDVLHTDWQEIEASYRRGQVIAEDKFRFLPPIMHPGKIIAIGQNYMDHIREQNATPPPQPLIFAKLPSAITGPDTVIEWDPTLATAVDYEAELAVIISQDARNVSPENALRHVFGYTCANDITARDLQKGDGQWTRAKGLDTFCPLGPWIVTADEIPDPQHLAIRCEVNGTALQDSNTSEMIFDIKTLITHASRAFTLHQGDILLTGTPNGVGFYRKPQTLLHDGDKVMVEIERIGKLHNTCREVKTL